MGEVMPVQPKEAKKSRIIKVQILAILTGFVAIIGGTIAILQPFGANIQWLQSIYDFLTPERLEWLAGIIFFLISFVYPSITWVLRHKTYQPIGKKEKR
jgi:uncharacterized membrane protein HdeD (DUF308 family)